MRLPIAGLLILLAICFILPVSAVVAEFSYVGGTATASSGAPANAFDSNAGTIWQSAGCVGEWVKFDFGAGNTHRVSQYKIQAEAANFLNAPAVFWFLGSTDGTTWFLLDNVTSLSWAGGEVKTFNSFSESVNISSYRYHYWRTFHTQGSPPAITVFQIAELELWGDDTDTTPPSSITGLFNHTPTCESIQWEWTNPGDSDYYQLITWKNNVLYANLSNSSATTTWSTLSENTAYTFSSKTKGLTGNINATFVNATATTAWCEVTPTPTETSNVTITAAAVLVREVTTKPAKNIIPWWKNDEAPVYLGLIAIALLILSRRK